MQRPVAFVVEDQASLIVLYEDALRLVGYDVIAVRDGLQALNQLEVNEPPTLIILDINLPGLSGRDLHKHIRKHARYDRTPVMILTANSVMAAAIRPEITKSDYLFIKPISMKELQNFAKQMRSIKSDMQEDKVDIQPEESLPDLELEEAEDTAKIVVDLTLLPEAEKTEPLPTLDTEEDDEDTVKNPNIHAETTADTSSTTEEQEEKDTNKSETK